MAQVKLRRHLTYEAIRSKILAGKFAPGQALSEVELARTLGTSRTPVREALMRLHEEALVEIIPRRGPLVRMLAPQEMQEILLVREALEGLAARMAAARIAIGSLKDLRAQWEELRATLSESSLDELHTKTEEFHSTIIASAGNQTLVRLLETLRDRIRSSRRLYLKALGRQALVRSRTLCDEHLRIIDALEAADADASARLMKAHIRAIRGELLREAPHDE